jgi:hypothetical protein
VAGEPLAKLFNTEYNDQFRKKANPIQFFSTAIILFFVSKVQKMNKLKCKGKIHKGKNSVYNCFDLHDFLHDYFDYCAIQKLQE